MKRVFIPTLTCFAERAAGWFVPAVIACAVAAFAVWALLGLSPALAYALVAAVIVLIIACLPAKKRRKSRTS